MKKHLFIFSFLFILMGCTNNYNAPNSETVSVVDFFTPGDFTFTGGFENAGFRTSRKIVKRNNLKFIVEETIDTATRVERIFLVNKDSISLVFVGEDTNVNIDDLDLTKGEIILKAPFTVGKTWKSGENTYEIINFIDAESGQEVTVEQRSPFGVIIRTTYQKGFGKIQRTTTMVN